MYHPQLGNEANNNATQANLKEKALVLLSRYTKEALSSARSALEMCDQNSTSYPTYSKTLDPAVLQNMISTNEKKISIFTQEIELLGALEKELALLLINFSTTPSIAIDAAIKKTYHEHDKRSRNSSSRTLIMCHCIRGLIEEIEILFEAGLVDINEKGPNGMTALHSVFDNSPPLINKPRQLKVLQQLLKFNANPSIRNNNNQTPREFASTKKFSEAADVLEIAEKKMISTGTLLMSQVPSVIADKASSTACKPTE